MAWWDRAYLLLVACMALAVLAAPVFPSQDGPVHLYYVDVLRALLHHAGPYTQHFTLKGMVTPYALEHYSLLVLETIFSPELSEKVLVCIYIFAFGLGFRYLVASVAGPRSPWCLAGIPFCMNMLVYLGFLNFSFGVASMLFLSGYWVRHMGRLHTVRVAVLLAGLVFMLLTHPVPVAVFLVFMALYLAMDYLQEAVPEHSWSGSLRARVAALVLLAVMGGMAVAWVALFVDRSLDDGGMPSYAAAYGLMQSASNELGLKGLAPFTARAYRVGPLLLLVLAAVMLARSSWKRDGRIRAPLVALTATSALCFLAYCLVPARINGSWFFPERFPICWAMFLIAAAASSQPSSRWNLAAGLAGASVACVVVAMQWSQVSSIAAQIRPGLDVAPVNAGAEGLIIGPPFAAPPGLAFDPYMWTAVHYFRQSGAILANAPWTDQPLLMVGLVHPDRWGTLDPEESTVKLRAQGAAPELDFVVQQGQPTAEMNAAVNGLGMRNTGGSRLFQVFQR